MGTLGEGLKSFNWITDRVDQLSGWLKKKRKRDYEDKVDKAVRNNDVGTISKLMSKVTKKRSKRRKES